MSRTEEHDQYAELAVGYALYALEPEEEQRFLGHLGACAACEQAVAEHTETLAHLAYAAEPADPPPALLEGIRDGVRASGREATFGPPVSLDAARHKRAERRRPALRRAATWVGAAAAFALIASLGVWNTSLQRDREQQQVAYGNLAQAVEAVRVQGARTVPLVGEGGAVVAVAVVHDDTMELVVDGLPPNDAAATSYVLWAKDRVGSVRPIGVFDVADQGVDVVDNIALTADGGDLTRFMVTHEEGNVAPAVSTRAVLAAGDAL